MTKDKWVFYPRGVKRIESYIKLYEVELKSTSKYCKTFGSKNEIDLNPKWIELSSKIELCRSLLS